MSESGPSSLADVEPSELITLDAADQLVFWNALCEKSQLTSAQERLGRLMRGEPLGD